MRNGPGRFLLAAGAAAGLVWLLWRRLAAPPAPAQRPAEVPVRTRVVVLGAGFGGLTAAMRLGRSLGPDSGCDVLLLDRHNYHLFTPLLYQAAVGLVDTMSIVFPVRAIAARHRVRFRMAEVQDIDLEARLVRTDSGEVPFDYLIIALGSVTSFYGLKDVAERALALKGISEAVAIRNRVITALERADAEPDPDRRRRQLAFAIAGAGPTGLEFAGALSALVHDVAGREYPSIRPEDVSIRVYEASSEILPGMPAPLKREALLRLAERGVQVVFNTPIGGVHDGQFVTADGKPIEAAMLVWAAGVRGSPLLERLPGERTRDGRLLVNECLQLPGYPNVYVIGDSAAFVPPGSDRRPLPATAPVAIQQGERAADNVLRQIRGAAPLAFRYRHRGNLVITGRYAAVADVYGVLFDGLLAWLVWRIVHLTWLTGLRNRLEVLLDWLLLYVTPRQTARLEAD